jgi:hypothetical protein
MKFQQYIDEEYYGRGGNYEVFKNPSKKEIIECSKASKSVLGSVRFLLTKDGKDLYVAPAALLHQWMAKVIDREEDFDSVKSPMYEDHYWALESFYNADLDVLHTKVSILHKNPDKDKITEMMKKHNVEIRWN